MRNEGRYGPSHAPTFGVPATVLGTLRGLKDYQRCTSAEIGHFRPCRRTRRRDDIQTMALLRCTQMVMGLPSSRSAPVPGRWSRSEAGLLTARIHAAYASP